MQFEISGTQAPTIAPYRWLALGVCLAAGGAVAFYWWQHSGVQSETAKVQIPTTRTAMVTAGELALTIRLTGTTGAENYVSLITPQLRGARHSAGASSSTSTSTTGTIQLPAALASNAGQSGASSSSSTSSASGSGSIGASTGFSTAGAFHAATSRSSSTQSSSTASSSSSSSSATAPTADPLGSTSGSLLNVTSTGAGISDYLLVLQELVNPGSVVRQGDLVAEFDRQYMLQRLDDYRAYVVQSDNDLKSLKAQLDADWKAHDQTIRSAKADVDKAELDLKTIPVRSAIDAEDYRLALDGARARYKQLLREVSLLRTSQSSQIRDSELDLQQSKLELRRAERNAGKMIMHAPIAGLTVMQNTFRGTEFSQIQKGDQLWPGMMFMQIVDTHSMIVDASVSQVDVEDLRLGMKATVHFDAYAGLELPAHIVSIAAMTKTGGWRANYVKEVPIRLRLDKMDPRVIPDLSVSVDIILKTRHSEALAPREAVFQDGARKPPYVLVAQPGSWERREVELGLANHVAVEVRSGLKPGEVIALERPIEARKKE